MKYNTMDIITKIDLFAFLHCFFGDAEQFDRLTDKAKLDHAFMLNRFLSINYPKEMQNLNQFNNVSVINCLHKAMCTGQTPRWIYTKSGKPNRDDFGKIPDNVKLDFCKMYNVEYKNLRDLHDMYPEWFISEIKALQKIEEQKINKKKSKI